MNTGEVLIDLLEDNWRRLIRVFSNLDEACLRWKPDPGGNSIAVTVWHMGRLFDHFFHTQALGMPAEAQCWFRNDWTRRTGYDPRGLGRDGWGTLNGYTQQAVNALAELFTSGAGFDGKYTRYQCIQMALLDNIRHLGEIFALQAQWERSSAAPLTAFRRPG